MNHLLVFAILSALASRCAAQGTHKHNDIAVFTVPAWNRASASNLLTQRSPLPTDVVSVKTLPRVTDDGKNVPQRTLEVKFSGTEAQIADGVGKRHVVDTAANLLQATTTNSGDGIVPSQAQIDTLGVCNVAPPPFRTLPTFEDTGSLSNGVVSLLFYNKLNSVANVCTGWLVHPRRVVTAAHCVFSVESKTSYIKEGLTLIVSTGLNGRDDSKMSRAAVSKYFVSEKYLKYDQWAESLKEGTDHAVLVLSTPLLGRTYRWSSPVAGLARMVLGYPGVSQTGFDQIGDIDGTPAGPISYGCQPGVTGGNILCEDLSTEGGHSGSPIFASFNSDTVVGTLSGGKRNGCPSLFTLAVPRVSGGMSPLRLLRTSGCTVTQTKGVYSVSRC